jgi:hypothetical protein
MWSLRGAVDCGGRWSFFFGGQVRWWLLDGGLSGVGVGPCAVEGVLQAGVKTLSRFCTATCDGSGCGRR